MGSDCEQAESKANDELSMCWPLEKCVTARSHRAIYDCTMDLIVSFLLSYFSAFWGAFGGVLARLIFGVAGVTSTLSTTAPPLLHKYRNVMSRSSATLKELPKN